MSLYDRPDPRRLDLRASLRDVRGDWLVRVHRQRASVPVHAIVDVSASMASGRARPSCKSRRTSSRRSATAPFGSAMRSACWPSTPRSAPICSCRAVVSRGIGSVMASMLRQCRSRGRRHRGTRSTPRSASPGGEGLVFLVSDFHWPLERLGAVLDLLAHAYVVPMIVWDPAEIEPPARGMRSRRWATRSPARVARCGCVPKLRSAVARRGRAPARRSSTGCSRRARSVRSMSIGAFDGEAMSQYFLEAVRVRTAPRIACADGRDHRRDQCLPGIDSASSSNRAPSAMSSAMW